MTSLYESETVELKEIARSDDEEILGIGTTHAINILKEILEQGLITKVGGGRQTRYVMK
nr:hypothetical protein [uncultured Niameybacter sp.]